ncbi:putative lipopolysaccharide heptosyltransferase III [Erwinia tracheiphila]|nr:putative lipopolysaccharide heptosyltransferase III [Erwinia tracheiphila]AXF78178.1 putative lipopolysaccharide heptosyltransferase III [Erwinia tracheiphila]UIA83104.1 putative lipopolysaccharide heptosyltransferase III [Erwinia tracheiphila]UIA88241.1 putative lipopolysaccharide heptosyltransferase III [Erwinia tracheiphila]UIA91682.1 putative lipopolysaccharide heptosyltransferase III [Erwinia tracheiphila]UIA96338.1 putative lipopolysaccharide heptosyltransferase III [Erwinia tracheiph
MSMPTLSPIPASFVPHKILLIKLRHHGDMLLITPVINALLQHYPSASLDVLLYKETRPMLQAHPGIRQLHIIDRNWKKEGSGQHIHHEIALVRKIRREHYDLVINLADQWRSAIMAKLSGSPLRIGFNFLKRQNILWHQAHTHLVSTLNHHELHTVEQNMAALVPLGIQSADFAVSMHYTDSDWQQTFAILARYHTSPERCIVIQPTSRWIFKCWEDNKVAGLIDALTASGYDIVLTAAPDKKEQAMIENILSLCHNPGVISLAGQLTLPQLAALIDHARLFIGVDSAPMHMAAALNTPCIALFGPSKLKQWCPWGGNNQIIWAGDYAPLPSPDSIDTKTETRYLSAIPLEVVVNAARKYLDE